jgi:ketosteroid isomerase-like protein
MTATRQGTQTTGAGPAEAESTEVVVGRHVQAFIANDVDAIMADFAADALLCTPEGPYRGHGEIRTFFERALPAFPAGSTTLDIKQQIVDGELFYVVWSSASPVADVPAACDVFLVRDGKLVYQCFAGEIIARQP